MPKKAYRHRLQRSVTQSLNDTRRCLYNLKWLCQQFEPHHPEYLPLLEAIAQMLIMAQDSLCAFHRHAWGHNPKGWSKE